MNNKYYTLHLSILLLLMKEKKSVPKTSKEPEKISHVSAETSPAPNYFSILFKSVLLSIVFLIVLLFIKKIDSYSQFYENKITGGYEEIASVKDIENYEDLETRKQLRWGNGYMMLKQLKAYIKDSNALVLVPPAKYIAQVNPQFGIAEPSVVYYMCGMKTCWGTAKNVYKCTHAFIVTPKGADVLKINSKQQIDSLLSIYKPYPYSL